MARTVSKKDMAIVTAIHAIDDAISSLKRQKAALMAALPVARKKPVNDCDRYITNPLTGKKEYY